MSAGPKKETFHHRTVVKPQKFESKGILEFFPPSLIILQLQETKEVNE